MCLTYNLYFRLEGHFMSKKTCMVMGLGGMGKRMAQKHSQTSRLGMYSGIIDTDTELLSNLGLFRLR